MRRAVRWLRNFPRITGRLQGLNQLNVLEELAVAILRLLDGDLEEARKYAARALRLYQRTGPKARGPVMIYSLRLHVELGLKPWRPK